MFDFLRLIKIILGGMGVYISSPFLVNAFSKACERLGIKGLGTVSGTAAERMMVLILQRGDPGGHYRRALAHFPIEGVAERIITEYYDPTGNGTKTAPVYRIDPSRKWIELAVTANFAFVWLSKEGHNQPVSINYLEKMCIPLIYSITGAMLAGVDVVTMGAGLPFDIPAVISALMQGQTLHYPIPVIGINGEKEKFIASFNPWEFFGEQMPRLTKQPAFLPIISSLLLAQLCKRNMPKGSFQGFAVEEDSAGGHNAPPRGQVKFDSLGQPIYGEKDRVDYEKLADLGFPFWIGGSCASPEKLAWAQSESVGACGVQVGSIFALCDESGLGPLIKADARRRGFRGELVIFKDPDFSPTGYPFNVARLPDTLSEPDVLERQVRVCSQGALVTPYRKDDGSFGYRCPSEPIEDYVRKGGKREDTDGKGCICKGLMFNTGLIDVSRNHHGQAPEAPVVTLGVDLSFLPHVMENENSGYSALSALQYLCNIK